MTNLGGPPSPSSSSQPLRPPAPRVLIPAPRPEQARNRAPLALAALAVVVIIAVIAVVVHSSGNTTTTGHNFAIVAATPLLLVDTANPQIALAYCPTTHRFRQNCTNESGWIVTRPDWATMSDPDVATSLSGPGNVTASLNADGQEREVNIYPLGSARSNQLIAAGNIGTPRTDSGRTPIIATVPRDVAIDGAPPTT